ncbi:cupredoxin domain-containing protein (plasmid) [Pseudoalteromonas sp. T1lg65]|uniref:cupredoxin domain-containing protein n=1 Tax=Pseudoalteromonas sp. T1lg65 TaxID=2077101 RepID=UPI003F79A258
MLVGGFFTAPSAAIESITIVLKDHLFQPDKVEVPANTKVRLIIENQDTQVEEFDSFDLNREKVLFPNRKSVIYIGPLMPGEYKFFGEFSPSTAQGIVVVKEEKGAS